MMRMLVIAGAAMVALMGSAGAQPAPSAHPGGIVVGMGDGAVRAPRANTRELQAPSDDGVSPATNPFFKSDVLVVPGAANAASPELYQVCAAGVHYACERGGRTELYDYPGEHAQRFDGVSPQGAGAARRAGSSKMRTPATTGNR